MADALEVVSAGANAAQKKVKTSGKKPRAKPVHPRTSEMVGNAIKSLKERGGSSLQAIKKYIAVNYKVDSEKLSPFIKKYLKSAVASASWFKPKAKEPLAHSSWQLRKMRKLQCLQYQLEGV